MKRYRKYGLEKNYRRDPTVELGLLMDNTGILLAFDLFPGNESEKVNMLPIIKRARVDYGFGRAIMVANHGPNTSDIIFYLSGKNTEDHKPFDGYVYGQSVRGADEEFEAWVLDQKDYVDTPIDPSPENAKADYTEVRNHSEIIFRHKSRVQKRRLRISREFNDGNIRKNIHSGQSETKVYYSAKYAAKQKLERDRAVERAKDLIV